MRSALSYPPAVDVGDLADHWAWFPEWTPERPLLMWYLTFEDAPEVVGHAERVQASLRGVEALDLVPPSWLHLTLDAVGFVDDLAPEQVDGVLDATRAATSELGLPTLTLGPVTTTRTALVLRAGPQEQLAELRSRLLESTAELLVGSQVQLRRGFSPHVSLAYGGDGFDGGSLAGCITDAWSGTTEVTTPRLTLAAVTRAERGYRWTVRSAFPGEVLRR